MIDALTDDSGIVAAIVVVVGLVVAGVGLVRPVLDRRRSAAAAAAALKVSQVQVGQPPPHSEAATVSFNVQNSGGGVAVLNRMELRVIEVGAITEERRSIPAAPIPRFDFKVKLSPSTTRYDVRARTFGQAPDHSYASGEVESFLIEITSTETVWYDLVLVIGWYDVTSPTLGQEETVTLDRLHFIPDSTGVL